jgi:phenylacetate-CoA ligase
MTLILTSDHFNAELQVRKRAGLIYPNLKLSDSTTLSELLKSIPILSKSDLEQHLIPKKQWLKSAILFGETSGTTDKTLCTPRGEFDLDWNAFNQSIAYKKFLQPNKDRVAILHPSILSPFVEASSIALKQLNIGQLRVFPIPNICDYCRIFDVLERYQITSIVSTPSLTYKILYEFQRNKNILPFSLCNLLLTGEELSQASINNLKRIVGKNCLVVPFIYGSSEAATLMFGHENGLFEPLLDDFIFELHPSGTSKEAKKLIVTWLKEGLMPILRYDTGDYFFAHTLGKNPKLKFLGRDGTQDVDYKFRNRLEEIFYSLSCPVYHYECKAIFDSRFLEINLFVKTSDSLPILIEEITKKIHDDFPNWKISVKFNPNDRSFLQFSPSPKTKKFIKC